MDEMTSFEDRLAARLRTDAMRGVPAVTATAMADAAIAAGRRRPLISRLVPTITGTRRDALVLAVAILIVLALLAVGVALSRPRTLPTGLLAFDSSGAVWVAPPIGGEPRQLLAAGVDTFAWAPDGRWIAAADRDEQVWVVRPDGSGARTVTSGRWPTWSRDGKTLAVLRTGPSGSYAVLHDVASGRETTFSLPDGFTSVDWIGWRGDGRLLVRSCAGCYTALVRSQTGVVNEADHHYTWRSFPGGEEVHLPAAARPGTLSPDGWEIAWSPCGWDAPTDCPGLFVTDIRSGATQQIGDPRAVAFDPMSWSPDGSWILYPEGPNDQSFIGMRMMRAATDGSGPIQVLSQDADQAVVSPDGKRVAFVPIADDLRPIELMAIDGTHRTELHRGSPVGMLAWQPTGAISTAENPAAAQLPPACALFQRDPYTEAPKILRLDASGCIRLPQGDNAREVDIDPDLDGGRVADLQVEGTGAVPGVAGERPDRITALGGATLVEVQPGGACDASLVPSSAAPSPPTMIAAGNVRRWCVHTRVGAILEVNLLGYDPMVELVLGYQRVGP